MNEELMISHALDLQAEIIRLQNKIIDLEKQLVRVNQEKNHLKEIMRPIPVVNPVVSETIEYLRIVAG